MLTFTQASIMTLKIDIRANHYHGTNDWYSKERRELLTKLEATMKKYHWSADSGELGDYYNCNFYLHVGYSI